MHDRPLKKFKELCNKKINCIIQITLSKLKNRYLEEIEKIPEEISVEEFLRIEEDFSKEMVWDRICEEDNIVDLYTCINNKITNIFNIELENFSDKNKDMLNEIQNIIKKYKR